MLRTPRQQHGWLWLLIVLVVLLLGACSSDGAQAEVEGPVVVEIISLDHAPIREATTQAADLVAEYGIDVALSAYHFDTAEGDSFAENVGLREHTPIAIFVNGESEFDIDGRTVTFLSFPQGEGTGAVAEGDWTIEDLRTVLDRAVLDLQGG